MATGSAGVVVSATPSKLTAPKLAKLSNEAQPVVVLADALFSQGLVVSMATASGSMAVSMSILTSSLDVATPPEGRGPPSSSESLL